MPLGMTIEETQRAYCDALGVPCDESCFSPERIIFITDKESEIYRSPMWYAVLSDEELRIRREAFAKRGLDIDGRKINQIQINMKQNNPLWEAIKFLLVLFLILLIATPQLVIAVLLLILMGQSWN